MQLNTLHSRGHQNADNFKWVALEVFFSQYCGDANLQNRWSFQDPVLSPATTYEPPTDDHIP